MNLLNRFVLLIGFCSFFLSFTAYGQVNTKYNKFWVQFTDKKDSPYSLLRPLEFLSQRAIDRRMIQGIALEMRDIPVNPNYIELVKETGATVYTTSKWFNGCTVHANEREIKKIEKLPFIKKIEATGKHQKKRGNSKRKKKRDSKADYQKINDDYGYGQNQITQLNGHLIHQMGYRGEGLLIAVLDGGFSNTDIMPFYDSLRANNRLLQSRDFVDNDYWAYESSSHGSKVLSSMGANLPGLLVGTAPDASYVCIKTEDVRSEYPVEEDNWVAGAEFADSIGADVINSSLGYTTFSERTFNHKYEDTNGNTSRATIAADIAAGKGILVVNSAGNEGGRVWRYIGIPADGDSVLAIGAVDVSGRRAIFSSQGPTSDGRTKPNVMARGEKTALGSLYGYKIDASNGTSFSAPVMAGMSASLWQAFPEKNSMAIFNALEQAGANAKTPNGKYGHGIPNFYKAFKILSEGKQIVDLSESEISTWINDNLIIHATGSRKKSTIEVSIKNIFGNEILTNDFTIDKWHDQIFEIEGVDDLDSGIYFIEIKEGNYVFRGKLLKKTARKRIRP